MKVVAAGKRPNCPGQRARRTALYAGKSAAHRSLRKMVTLLAGVFLAGCAGHASPVGAGRTGSTAAATQPPGAARTGGGTQSGGVASTKTPATAGSPSGSATPAVSTSNISKSKKSHGNRSPVTPSAVSSISGTLSPKAEWTTQITPSTCGTMDTREWRAGVLASPVSPGGGGLLTVYLQNNTNLCGGRGSTLQIQGALSLDFVPLGVSSQAPSAQVSLPAAPPDLASGARAALAVRVSGGLRPGWYTASLVGTLKVDGGAPFQLSGPPPFGASGNVLVAGANRPAGASTRTAGPAPRIGGLTMPLVHLSWTSNDMPDFVVHAPVVCGPGTDRAAQFGTATATASGPGFTTELPSVGSGDNPAKAERSRDFGRFPGEAATLTLQVPVHVRACNGTSLGAVLGSGIATWQVVLPG